MGTRCWKGKILDIPPSVTIVTTQRTFYFYIYPVFTIHFLSKEKAEKIFEISTLIPIRSEGRSWQRDMESTAEPMDAQPVGYRTSPPTPLKVTVNEQICVSGLNGVANTFKVTIDNQQGKWIYYYDYITTLFGSHGPFILTWDFWLPMWSIIVL